MPDPDPTGQAFQLHHSGSTHPARTNPSRLASDPSPSTTTPRNDTPRGGALHDQPPRPAAIQVLLRKEVIQPHLPVRLPCYDFVPIASPTFDGSLPAGLGHRLRVLPTFVT